MIPLPEPFIQAAGFFIEGFGFGKTSERKAETGSFLPD
jgi:hypothetical protein